MKDDGLFGLYKKNIRKVSLFWTIFNIVYTLLLIPLLKFVDGHDYSMLWKIIAVSVDAALIFYNIKQSASFKKQLNAVSEHKSQVIEKELESCTPYRKLYFTSEYLFSTEGVVLPYYEIDALITLSYTSSPTATSLLIKTKSFGNCRVRIGLGVLPREFYETFIKHCPTAEIVFKVNFQKADMEEYYNTIKKESITVVRSRNNDINRR